MDVIEPYLLQLGFLDRTPQGRMATALAYQHLGLDVPASRHALSRALRRSKHVHVRPSRPLDDRDWTGHRRHGCAGGPTLRFGIPIGRLPGDIRFQGENVTCLIPIASMISISLLLTLAVNILLRLLK